jgi:hypothetical protein
MRRVCILVFVLAVLPSFCFAQAELTRQVMTSAAVACSSEAYSLRGTLGGTIMRAVGPNDGFTMIQGFWNPTAEWTSEVPSSSGQWQFALRQNQPNPFNPTTAIQFVVADKGLGRTRLTIYDVTGRCVKTLVDKTLAPGPQSAVWDGLDDNHRPVVAGVYFALLQSGQKSARKQLVLLK